MTKRILIGEITTVHGIKGLVKVRSYVDDIALFNTDKLFTDGVSGKTIILKLKNALKGDWLAEANNITDRTEAEKLRGTKLYIDRAVLPETQDGEFYVEDMIGMKIIDTSGNDVGTLISIENFGASDLLDIKPAAGGSNFYLPFTDDTVTGIDADAKTIMIEMPDKI